MKLKIYTTIITVILIAFIIFNLNLYRVNNIPINELVQENALCGQGEGCSISDKRTQGFEVGDQIPNIELVDFEGNKTNIYDLLQEKDKFILSFAADWCSDCQRQDKKLATYYNDLPSEYGAAVVFVDYSSLDGTQTTSKEQSSDFVSKMNYPFPTFWDEDGKLAKEFNGIKSTPTNIVLDSNGIIKAKTEEIDMDILFLPNEDTTYFKNLE